jgi:hypothetical protein
MPRADAVLILVRDQKNDGALTDCGGGLGGPKVIASKSSFRQLWTPAPGPPTRMREAHGSATVGVAGPLLLHLDCARNPDECRRHHAWWGAFARLRERVRN